MVSTLSVLAASVHFTAAAVVFAVLLMAIHANRRSTDILTLQLNRMDTVVSASGTKGRVVSANNIHSHATHHRGHRGGGGGGAAGGLDPPPGHPQWRGWEEGVGTYAGFVSASAVAMPRAPSPGEPPLGEKEKEMSVTRTPSSGEDDPGGLGDLNARDGDKTVTKGDDDDLVDTDVAGHPRVVVFAAGTSSPPSSSALAPP